MIINVIFLNYFYPLSDIAPLNDELKQTHELLHQRNISVDQTVVAQEVHHTAHRQQRVELGPRCTQSE
jgi:hypothetical protein